ncbi:MAG TPA: permease-like cell division protein FtsX [Chitinophagaceae bacterium]|nr:permease-like cell division protein FtsX [Chitinophagaceae bacterium]
MKQAVKGSSKRSKPSYFMAILGITLVLITLGTLGWIIINANKIGDYYKENVEVRAYLRENISKKDSAALVQYIASRPYVKSYEYVTKEGAKAKFMSDGNDDWKNVLTVNPLPASIDFKLNSQYVNSDTLAAIKQDLEKNIGVNDVQYPNQLVSSISGFVQKLSLILLGLAIGCCIVSIILIDNTIRLAMFSNRFLIKTMQMVGATRGFIARPLTGRAILNGAISAAIAIVIIFGIVSFLENYLPALKAIKDDRLLIVLFIVLIGIGIGISLISTYRSVVKYLKMKLDDLY